MGYSIKRRLLVGLLSLTAVVIVIAIVKNYFETRHEIEELFDAQLVQAARSLLALSSHELHEQLAFLSQSSGQDASTDTHQLIQIHKYEQSMTFQIWLTGGHLAVRSESAPDTPLTHAEKIFTDIEVNGTQLRVYALSNDDDTMQVQVAENYAERDRLSNSIALRLMASLAVILPLLGFLLSFIVTRTMEPLNRIAREIESRRGEDLQPVSDRGIPNEAKPMITALNHLFNRLNIAFENISRFTADAAHELRTPLASLKVNTQVAMNARDESQRSEALSDVMSSVDGATTLVQQLLILSRLDPEGGSIKNEQTELREMTEEIVADMATDALSKQIDIGMESDGPVLVFGKRVMLVILLRNLLQNAILYTSTKGVIDIELKIHGDKVKLSIADSGPGIPENERQDVFRRFYRGNVNKVPGTGLGLSIAQRIVEIHQASISLNQSKYGGLLVEIIFDCAFPMSPGKANQDLSSRVAILTNS